MYFVSEISCGIVPITNLRLLKGYVPVEKNVSRSLSMTQICNFHKLLINTRIQQCDVMLHFPKNDCEAV